MASITGFGRWDGLSFHEGPVRRYRDQNEDCEARDREMAKNAKHQRAADRSKQRSARVIPLDQVSPAVLTASRDVAYILEQFCFSPEPEDLLKAVLERAEHLEQQAMGITVLED